MRRIYRVDSNQAEIVAALKRSGCAVQPLTAVGSGCPDLLVSRAGVNHLLELKADSELAQAQIAWINAWNAKVHVVRSIDEALAAVGLAKARKL
jgi:hypothetical protein